MTGRENQRVLIVDDDDQWQRLLAKVLARGGFEPVAAYGANAARALIRLWGERPFAYALVDHCLPDGRGIDLIRELMALVPEPVTALVTGFLNDILAIEGQTRGALVVPKPASEEALRLLMQQLQARYEAQSGAAPRFLSEELGVGGFSLIEQVLSTPTQRVRLRLSEAMVLRHVMLRAGDVVHNSELAKKVLGRQDPAAIHALRQVVYDLRAALGHERDVFQTVRGTGYRFARGYVKE